MREEPLQKEIGLVRAIKHYLVSVEGLPSARVHDVVISEDGSRALVSSLDHDAVEIMMLDTTDVRPGHRFELSRSSLQLTLGDALLGRAVNALTDPIDGLGRLPQKNSAIILEREAGHVAERKTIEHQLLTGYLMTDTVLPIAKGQRQLLMGPIQSGIDLFCQEVFLQQEGQNMVCVYVTVGKSPIQVKRLVERLLTGAAKQYTTVVASTSADSVPLNSIAPAVGLQIAEYFSENGNDVLLVVDDLYTHARYLREIGLLQGRLPGRESYPGDIFYQQAHLIERAGSFTNKGSITFLPVLQTNLESTTDLIMTNIMGTTDGHLSFSPTRFAQGIFPPILEEESVTRVGRLAQSIVQKQLATSVTSTLAEAREQERFQQFGSQVSEASRMLIGMGHMLRTLLNQQQGERLSPDVQVLLAGLAFTTFAQQKADAFTKTHAQQLQRAFSGDTKFEALRKHVWDDKGLDTFLQALEGQTKYINTICQI